MVATETGDGAEIALRYALGRAQKAEQDACTLARRWQQAVRECEALRSKLAAIEDSDEYQGMQSLCGPLGPQGSLRRKYCAAGFRGVRHLHHGLRSCVDFLRANRSNRSESEDVGQPNGLPAMAAQPSAPGVLQNAEPCRPTPITPGNLAYHPTSWRLSDGLADAEFLDLLILSPVHRTGSTLLQRICNSRKETLIWGEHGGVLMQFASIFVNAACFSMAGEAERKQYFSQGENPNLWIANMCPELEYVQQAVVNSARTLMNTLYGPYRKNHDILGFKEVQYRRDELELLRRCYPKAQFLLLLRNPLDAWKSTGGDWYPSLEDWTAKYNSGVLGYHAFAKDDANSHLLRYEDLIGQESKAMAVLTDVACVSREQISMVLAHKIGSNPRSLSDSDRDAILATCRESMELLGYPVTTNV